jgi:hypothetical protein
MITAGLPGKIEHISQKALACSLLDIVAPVKNLIDTAKRSHSSIIGFSQKEALSLHVLVKDVIDLSTTERETATISVFIESELI